MLSVELKNLGKQVRPAARFLISNLDESVSLHGSRVELKQANAKTVKLLLHKFLRQEGLDNYRIILKPGSVEILPPKEPKKHYEPERSNVGFNQTIPYYQVAAETGGVVPRPGGRKWRASKNR